MTERSAVQLAFACLIGFALFSAGIAALIGVRGL